MLEKLNKILEKMMPLITPSSVVIGVLFSHTFHDLKFIIPWVFAFMTFAGSLTANFNSIKQTIYHPKPIFLVFFILHVLMPTLAWGIGQLFFHGDMLTITGLVLAMAIPTGISSMIWVTIYRGNIPLTLSIIMTNTFLSPFIVPITLFVFFQQTVEMDVFSMMKGLIGMVVLPSILGILLNEITKGKIKALSPRLSPFTKLGIALVVIINAAVVAPYLKDVNVKLLAIAFSVLFIAFMGYLISFFMAKGLKQDKETVISVTFTGGMRNISAGAVIAVSYFPAPVAIPVVIGMLFQQVLASSYGFMVDRYFKKRNHDDGYLKTKSM